MKLATIVGIVAAATLLLSCGFHPSWTDPEEAGHPPGRREPPSLPEEQARTEHEKRRVQLRPPHDVCNRLAMDWMCGEERTPDKSGKCGRHA